MTRLELGTIYREPSYTLQLSISLHSPGKTRIRGGVALCFRSTSTDGWKYLKYHDVVLLVDGERWPYEPKHDGDVETGSVTEHLFVHLSEEKFLKLVNAKSVEMKVGPDKWAMGVSEFNALRDFASIVANPEVDPLRPRPMPPRALPRSSTRAPEPEKFRKQTAEEKATQKKADLERRAAIQFQVGLNLEKDGKRPLALRYFKEVVRDYPDTSSADKAKQKLADLAP